MIFPLFIGIMNIGTKPLFVKGYFGTLPIRVPKKTLKFIFLVFFADNNSKNYNNYNPGDYKIAEKDQSKRIKAIGGDRDVDRQKTNRVL